MQVAPTLEMLGAFHALWVHAPHKELFLWNTFFRALITNNCSRPHVLRAIETAAVHLPQEMNSQRRGHTAAGAIDGLKIHILEPSEKSCAPL